MSSLVTLTITPEFEPECGAPSPSRVISGNPTAKTWILDQACEDSIHTGIWEATPGETRAIKGDTFEFCHILSGVVEVIEDGGLPVRYEAGQSFLLKPGFVGVWKTIETVRKIFVVCE
ncbi:cupin domain-containing protein [Caballeronia sp. HLA56]